MRSVSLYIHIPFCVRKCAYCDFNSYPICNFNTNRYITALIKEINAAQNNFDSVPTIYFGGGTPSLLKPEQLSAIMTALKQRFPIADTAEISIEANPGTVSGDYFVCLRQLGINRVSIGVQSFDDDLLKLLGRIHTKSTAVTAIEMARKAEFKTINIDLIYGIPEQKLNHWQDTLTNALSLNPDSLSIYSLIVEENTPFYIQHSKNELNLPSEDEELDMTFLTLELTQKHGYRRYEISNFAKHGHECKQNITYWQNEEYLGFGAGAVSYFDEHRTTNHHNVNEYIDAIELNKAVICNDETLSESDRLGETLMLGLRMIDGIKVSELQKRFSIDVLEYINQRITKVQQNKLVYFDGETCKLTEQGLLLANDVFIALLT